MRLFFSALALALASTAPPVQAVEIDGRIDAQEWAGARHIREFVQVQPLTGAPATLATEAWVLATPKGLAVAFRNAQPADVPRTRQRTRRDQDAQLDRVNVMVDFEGDGRTGYNVMVTVAGGIADAVVTNERQFNSDWDGDWRYAVAEDEDGWSAEFLIPWHIAPQGRAQDGRRHIGLYLDRVVGSTGERVAWPGISFSQPRFLSGFARVEVPDYHQALLAVTPYVSATHDRVRGDTARSAGADLFWKVNGQFQLAATLNPDFGQVESDSLVVNFSAVESFFGDKRPFFTENQGLFEVPFGVSNSRLLYTRRIGGPADDGRGPGDVRAAVKLNGSLGDTRYGLLAASEGGAAGREFYALRATRDFGPQDLGGMVTHVDRPFLDRQATVYSVDHLWTPNASIIVRSQAVASSVRQAGARSQGSGLQVRADQDFGNGWRHQLHFLHLSDDLQLNDIGYLDRNDFNYLRYEVARRRTDLPVGSRYASHEWRGAVSQRRNDQGMYIADAFAITRRSERRDGGSEFIDIAGWSAGKDDLILRGNGVVRVPEKLWVFYERSAPRRGHWSWYGNLRGNAEGLDGAKGMGLRLYMEPTLHLSDDLSLGVGLQLHHQPDWLLWRGGSRLGSFRSDAANLSANMQWQVGDRQELRLKLEAIAIDARLRQAWHVAADGSPLRVDEPIPDFSVRNLGFQVRYRYALAPLSDLYVVYARGGFAFDEDGRSVGRLLGEAFSLRDEEQFLVKLSYRFTI